MGSTISTHFSKLLNHLKPLKTPLALTLIDSFLVLSILSNILNENDEKLGKTTIEKGIYCSSLVLSTTFRHQNHHFI